MTKTNAMNVNRNDRQSIKVRGVRRYRLGCETMRPTSDRGGNTSKRAGARPVSVVRRTFLSCAEIVSNRPAKCSGSQGRDRDEYDVQACADDGYRGVA